MSESHERVVIEADGGSRGNPGIAGYGAVVLDAGTDIVLAARRGYLGIATNNVAEYRGLIAGLEAAAELGARRVAVRLDSKLVVEQMCGRWKVKHPDMIPLAAWARELVAQFDESTFEWIPRARNSRADKLANEAMDARDDTVERVEMTAEPVVTGSISGPGEAAGAKVTASHGPGWTGAVGRPTRFLLLRHGQTELSVERRYSGRGNPPLTDLGRDQAQRAARWVAAKGGIAAVVSSPLERARATAEAAARGLGIDVEIHEGLIETDFGEWEGATFAEASARDPELHARWLGDASVHPPGGESFVEVRERVAAVRDDLVARYPAANVLVVTHVTPIKTLLQLALGVGPSLLYRLHLDLASMSIAEFYPDGGSSVRLANGTGHLDG